VNLCKLLSRPLALPDFGGGLWIEEAGLSGPWLKKQVVEEAGCQACEKLSPGERVCWEVISPGGSPVPATEL
jgi:hypothetical protein